MTENKKSKTLITFILNHRKLTTMVIILLYLVLTFITCCFAPIQEDEIKFSLNRIELSAEIVSFFFIVVSSIIAVWQYYVSCKNEHIKNETERIQKSIELIEYYKNNVLDKTSAIICIFKYAKISEIMNGIDKSKIKDFDVHELNQLLTSDKIKKLKEIEQGEDFITAILMANEAFNLSLPGATYSDKTPTQEIANRVKVYNAFMSNFISDTLNNLEYFAMYFAHNIADESVIYQSAHQTYLNIVELLYYNISNLNTPDNSKYYTNLIDLYNIWKKRQTKQHKEIVDGQRCAVKKGSNATNIEI